MSFWLEDDNTHGAVANHNPWSLSGSSSSAAAAASHPQDPPQPAQEEPQQEGSHALWSQPETQDSSTVYLSQQEQLQFVCDNCGGTECYLDDATGRDVCALCFTESQQSQSQQLLSQPGADTVADFEDVVALAARHAGGRIRQQKRSTKKKQQQQAASGETRRYKQPLEEVDRSVPLPDLSVCLRGMQRVLQTCVDRAVAQVEAMELVVEQHPTRTAGANNDSDNDDDDDDDWDGVEAQQEEPLFVESSASQSRQQEYRDAAREMIQSLWKSYLRAWADGAEHYGAMYPHVRFCFRDLFLVSMHASLVVRRQLVHQVATTIKQEEIDEPFGRLPRRDGDASDDSSSDHDGDDDNDEDEEDPKDKSENVKKEMGGIRLGAMRKIVAAHTSFRNPMGYKEAALYLRPSMHMAAALIWMALTKNKKASLAAAPVTSHDVCRWIATGKLPLMTAFHSLLSPKLQKRLQPVSTFFRIDKPLLPCELEAMAINLCVACRLRKTPKLVNEDGEDSGDEDDDSSDASSTATGKASKQSAPQASSDNDGDNRSNELTAPAIVVKKRKRQRVRFWSVADLPRIMAQLVADAGMDQNVLDRSLVLAGYSLEGPSPRRHRKQLRPPPPDEPSSRRPSSGSEKTRNDTAAEKPLTNLSDHLSRLPTLVEPEALTCAEEVLALIAIACQLDPQWRTWKYSSSTLLQQPTQQQQQRSNRFLPRLHPGTKRSFARSPMVPRSTRICGSSSNTPFPMAVPMQTTTIIVAARAISSQACCRKNTLMPWEVRWKAKWNCTKNGRAMLLRLRLREKMEEEMRSNSRLPALLFALARCWPGRSCKVKWTCRI